MRDDHPMGAYVTRLEGVGLALAAARKLGMDEKDLRVMARVLCAAAQRIPRDQARKIAREICGDPI